MIRKFRYAKRRQKIDVDPSDASQAFKYNLVKMEVQPQVANHKHLKEALKFSYLDKKNHANFHLKFEWEKRRL